MDVKIEGRGLFAKYVTRDRPGVLNLPKGEEKKKDVKMDSRKEGNKDIGETYRERETETERQTDRDRETKTGGLGSLPVGKTGACCGWSLGRGTTPQLVPVGSPGLDTAGKDRTPL